MRKRGKFVYMKEGLITMKNELFSGELKFYSRYIKIMMLMFMIFNIIVYALRVDMSQEHMLIAFVLMAFMSFNIALIWTKIMSHNTKNF